MRRQRWDLVNRPGVNEPKPAEQFDKRPERINQVAPRSAALWLLIPVCDDLVTVRPQRLEHNPNRILYPLDVVRIGTSGLPRDSFREDEPERFSPVRQERLLFGRYSAPRTAPASE